MSKLLTLPKTDKARFSLLVEHLPHIPEARIQQMIGVLNESLSPLSFTTACIDEPRTQVSYQVEALGKILSPYQCVGIANLWYLRNHPNEELRCRLALVYPVIKNTDLRLCYAHCAGKWLLCDPRYFAKVSKAAHKI